MTVITNASKQRISRRLRRAEDLSSMTPPPPPNGDAGESRGYPLWVDQHAIFMWDHGNFGGVDSMIALYGLKDRLGDLERMSYYEKQALNTCDFHDAWTAYLIRFGDAELKIAYAQRRSYSSPAFKAWEQRRDEFRERWLWGTDGPLFDQIPADELSQIAPRAARYHKALLRGVDHEAASAALKVDPSRL